VRLDAGKSMVSSTNSIASRHDVESRLESPWLWKASVEHPWVDLQGNQMNGWH
jgi:hypothetical protein